MTVAPLAFDATTASAPFSETYAEARARFLAAAATRGLAVTSYEHPLKGIEGETLAMDVARDGPADAEAMLIVSSACHGIEGYCGSGVQLQLLGDDAFHRAGAEAGVAVLYIHGLNPHGFSWGRRTTNENVDLNRNFQDFSKPLPVNAGYAALAGRIVPDTWPPTAENEAALAAYAATHGPKAVQTAMSAGQYAHPDGIFFGGTEPTWSHRTVRDVLRTDARACRRLGWIDLHTGLGPSGHGERIWAGADDDAAVARARRWWGRDITSIFDGSSTSARLTGMMWLAAYEEAPQAEYTGIAMEYGTLPVPDVMAALRADQWAENHPEISPAARAAIRRQVRDAFYTDTPQWKAQILTQGREAAFQGVHGLAGA